MVVLQGLEFYISKRAGKAITDYQMLSDGDKIAVAVSGGKDSLTLLRVLHDRQSFVPIKVEEDMIVRFARSAAFPHQKCVCPNSITSKRTEVSNMIKELEKICLDIKTNIFRSIKRIKKEYLL